MRPKAPSNFDCAHLNYKLYVGSTKLSSSSTLLLSAEVHGFSWNCACFLNLLTVLFLLVGGTGLWYNVRNIIFHRGLQHGMDYTLLIFIAWGIFSSPSKFLHKMYVFALHVSSYSYTLSSLSIIIIFIVIFLALSITFLSLSFFKLDFFPHLHMITFISC